MRRPPIQRGIGWYRYRAISGAILATVGIVIGVRLTLAPGPLASKVLGYAFVLVTLAFGVVRVQQYRQARETRK